MKKKEAYGKMVQDTKLMTNWRKTPATIQMHKAKVKEREEKGNTGGSIGKRRANRRTTNSMGKRRKNEE